MFPALTPSADPARRRRIAGAGLLLSVTASLAVAVAPAAGRELMVRTLSLAPGYPEAGAFLHDGSGKSKGVELDVKTFLNHEAQEIDVEGNELVITADSAATSVAKDSAVLGKVQLPSGASSCLFVLRPAQGEHKAEAYVLDDSKRAFPKGSFTILNLAPGDLRIELEDRKFDCPAGEATLIDDPPAGDGNAAAMRAFIKEGDKWVRVAAAVWPHPGSKRVLQIVSSDPSGRFIRLKGYRDVASPR